VNLTSLINEEQKSASLSIELFSDT